MLFSKKEGRPKGPERLFPLLALGCKLSMGVALLRGWQARRTGRHLEKLRASMERRKDQLQGANQKLLEEIQGIQSSPLYAQRMLKDLYHKKAPGERLLFFPKED